MSKKNQSRRRDELEDIASKLQQASARKIQIPKILKDVLELLKNLEPISKDAESALQRVADLLSSGDVLDSPAPGVQVPLVLCFLHILRLREPHCPFHKAEQVKFTKHVISAMQLTGKSSPSDQQSALEVLKLACQANIGKRVLDLGDADLTVSLATGVLECFDHCKKGVQSGVEPLLQQVLHQVLIDANDEAAPVLLDLLFHYLLQTAQKQESPVVVLINSFLRKHAPDLQRQMQVWLTSHVKASKTTTHRQLPIMVSQLLGAVEQPTMNVLVAALQSADPHERLLAAQVLLRFLVSKQSTGLNEDNSLVPSCLLDRLHDSHASVRAAVLEHIELLYTHVNSAAMRIKVLQELQDRIRDIDPSVRSAAVGGGGKMLAARCGDLQQQTDLLREATMRLRDTELVVRKQAIKSLLQLFHRTCHQMANGDKLDQVDAGVLSVVPQVMAVCVTDVELRLGVLEGALLPHGTLLPADLPSNTVVDIWVQMHQAGTGSTVSTWEPLLRLLSLSCRFLTDVLRYAHLLSKPAPKKNIKEVERQKRQIQAVQQDLIHQMPEMAKMAQLRFEQAAGMNAKTMFAALLQVANPFAAKEVRESSIQQVKEQLAKQGADSGLTQLVAVMTRRSAPRLMPPSHMHALLRAAQGPRADAVAPVLASIGKAIPIMLLGQCEAVVELACQEDATHPDFYKLLAAIAPVYKQLQPVLGNDHVPVLTKKLLKSLRKLCQAEHPRAGKACVLALQGFNSEASAAEKELVFLLQDLLHALEQRSDNLATVVLAISKIAQLMPGAFSQHLIKFVDFVVGDYLESLLGQVSEGSACTTSQWNAPSPAALNLVFTLKAVVNALTPDLKSSSDTVVIEDYTTPVEATFVALTSVLEGLAGHDNRNHADLGVVRLAAAAQMLRLMRRHDRSLTPAQYLELALVAQDSVLQTRQHFSAKVLKQVNQLYQGGSAAQLAAKLMAILPLSAMDPVPAHQVSAYRAVQEFVAKRRALAQQQAAAAAQVATSSASGGTTLSQQPEFLLPYYIYILSHHPDYPPTGSPSADYTPFVQMLQFALAPLLSMKGSHGVGATLGVILKMLRVIKQTADATDDDRSEHIYEVCDIAMLVARDIAKDFSKVKDARVQDYAGPVPLPRSLYNPTPLQDGAARRRDGSHLPAGLNVPRFTEPTLAASKTVDKPSKKRKTTAAPQASRAKKKAALQAAKPLRPGARAAASAARAAMIKAKQREADSEDHDEDMSDEEDDDDEEERDDFSEKQPMAARGGKGTRAQDGKPGTSATAANAGPSNHSVQDAKCSKPAPAPSTKPSKPAPVPDTKPTLTLAAGTGKSALAEDTKSGKPGKRSSSKLPPEHAQQAPGKRSKNVGDGTEDHQEQAPAGVEATESPQEAKPAGKSKSKPFAFQPLASPPDKQGSKRRRGRSGTSMEQQQQQQQQEEEEETQMAEPFSNTEKMAVAGPGAADEGVNSAGKSARAAATGKHPAYTLRSKQKASNSEKHTQVEESLLPLLASPSAEERQYGHGIPMAAKARSRQQNATLKGVGSHPLEEAGSEPAARHTPRRKQPAVYQQGASKGKPAVSGSCGSRQQDAQKVNGLVLTPDKANGTAANGTTAYGATADGTTARHVVAQTRSKRRLNSGAAAGTSGLPGAGLEAIDMALGSDPLREQPGPSKGAKGGPPRRYRPASADEKGGNEEAHINTTAAGKRKPTADADPDLTEGKAELGEKAGGTGRAKGGTKQQRQASQNAEAESNDIRKKKGSKHGREQKEEAINKVAMQKGAEVLDKQAQDKGAPDLKQNSEADGDAVAGQQQQGQGIIERKSWRLTRKQQNAPADSLMASEEPLSSQSAGVAAPQRGRRQPKRI